MAFTNDEINQIRGAVAYVINEPHQATTDTFAAVQPFFELMQSFNLMHPYAVVGFDAEYSDPATVITATRIPFSAGDDLLGRRPQSGDLLRAWKKGDGNFGANVDSVRRVQSVEYFPNDGDGKTLFVVDTPFDEVPEPGDAFYLLPGNVPPSELNLLNTVSSKIGNFGTDDNSLLSVLETALFGQTSAGNIPVVNGLDYSDAETLYKISTSLNRVSDMFTDASIYAGRIGLVGNINNSTTANVVLYSRYGGQPEERAAVEADALKGCIAVFGTPLQIGGVVRIVSNTAATNSQIAIVTFERAITAPYSAYVRVLRTTQSIGDAVAIASTIKADYMRRTDVAVLPNPAPEGYGGGSGSGGGVTIVRPITVGDDYPRERIRLTAGDTGQVIEYQLRGDNGESVALSDGETVTMRLLRRNAMTGAAYACTVEFAQEGRVSALIPSVPEAGDYEAVWRLGGKTYPLGRRVPVVIEAAIAVEEEG